MSENENIILVEKCGFIRLHEPENNFICTETEIHNLFAIFEEEKANAVEVEREACAVLAETNKLISGSIGPLFNAGWSAANGADANGIRARTSQTEPKPINRETK